MERPLRFGSPRLDHLHCRKSSLCCSLFWLTYAYEYALLPFLSSLIFIVLRFFYLGIEATWSTKQLPKFPNLQMFIQNICKFVFLLKKSRKNNSLGIQFFTTQTYQPILQRNESNFSFGLRTYIACLSHAGVFEHTPGPRVSLPSPIRNFKFIIV